MQRLSEQLAQQQDELFHLRQQLRKLNPHREEKATPTIPASSPVFLSSPTASLENLIGLRLIHLIGIVVLVIGLSLGVKYAIDKNLVSEGMRIILAYLAGGVLYFFSLRLKKAYSGFSAILFSGAMASMYFTTFGACVYYQFLSYTASFIIMIVLTVYTTIEALRYDRQEIALLGLVGAYGIPFLISPDRGHPEMLFLYVTIINTGVLFLCSKKPWQALGRAAQVISWLLFLGWAAWQNDERLKTYGLIFMFLFFAVFTVIAVSEKLFRKGVLSTTASYQLLTNNIAFYVAGLLVFGYSFANSTIALISLLLAFFAGLQAIGYHYWKERFTSQVLGCYALLLFTIFIGFQWKGIIVTLAWLLTAVIVFAAGLRLKSMPARMAAIALMGTTLLKLLIFDSARFSTLQKVISYLVLGVLLLVVSYFYQRYKGRLFGE